MLKELAMCSRVVLSVFHSSSMDVLRDHQMPTDWMWISLLSQPNIGPSNQGDTGMNAMCGKAFIAQ
jgi:hypothetical protein